MLGKWHVLLPKETFWSNRYSYTYCYTARMNVYQVYIIVNVISLMIQFRAQIILIATKWSIIMFEINWIKDWYEIEEWFAPPAGPPTRGTPVDRNNLAIVHLINERDPAVDSSSLTEMLDPIPGTWLPGDEPGDPASEKSYRTPIPPCSLSAIKSYKVLVLDKRWERFLRLRLLSPFPFHYFLRDCEFFHRILSPLRICGRIQI